MAGEQLSLSDILSDEKPKEPEAPAPAAPAEAPAAPDAAAVDAEEQRREDYKSKRNKARDKEAIAQGKVRDPDTGQFVSPKDAPAAPAKAPEAKAEEPAKAAPAAPAAPAAAPQQEFTDKEKAFLRAAQEERQKRQALEQQLAALRSGQAQPGTPPAPKKTFWDDPDGALAQHSQTVEQTVVNARLNVAETIARSQHPDFDEKVAVFREILTNAGPNAAVIAQQWLAAPDPAMFAFNMGKNHMELKQVGNLDALRDKITKETEARVRATVEAEFKAKEEALAKERAALPPSLSDARAGSSNRVVWEGPPPMADILK
jgi:hypothetical protein